MSAPISPPPREWQELRLPRLATACRGMALKVSLLSLLLHWRGQRLKTRIYRKKTEQPLFLLRMAICSGSKCQCRGQRATRGLLQETRVCVVLIFLCSTSGGDSALPHGRASACWCPDAIDGSTSVSSRNVKKIARRVEHLFQEFRLQSGVCTVAFQFRICMGIVFQCENKGGTIIWKVSQWSWILVQSAEQIFIAQGVRVGYTFPNTGLALMWVALAPLSCPCHLKCTSASWNDNYYIHTHRHAVASLSL